MRAVRKAGSMLGASHITWKPAMLRRWRAKREGEGVRGLVWKARLRGDACFHRTDASFLVVHRHEARWRVLLSGRMFNMNDEGEMDVHGPPHCGNDLPILADRQIAHTSSLFSTAAAATGTARHGIAQLSFGTTAHTVGEWYYGTGR